MTYCTQHTTRTHYTYTLHVHTHTHTHTREYGDNWHKQGIFEKKQNVFDDFIAAAEYLNEKKYTNPKR